MNTPPLTFPFQVCIEEPIREPFVKNSLEQVFGWSFLGYCRNMAVQHDGLHRRGPATYVDVKGSLKVNENTILVFMGLHGP